MYADDLSHVWCQWAEMEVKHANYRRAIDLLARAVRAPPSANQRLTADQLKVCLQRDTVAMKTTQKHTYAAKSGIVSRAAWPQDAPYCCDALQMSAHCETRLHMLHT